MPIPDPGTLNSHTQLVEQGLAYIGILFGGIFGTHSYQKLRERRNGKSSGESIVRNGDATLRDVVAAIRDEGEKTRSVIVADGDKTRGSMVRIQDVVNAAHDKTIAAVERNSDKQMSICNAQVLRAEKGLDELKEMRRQIKER